MFRLWGKEFKENRMLRDTVICDDTSPQGEARVVRYGVGRKPPHRHLPCHLPSRGGDGRRV